MDKYEIFKAKDIIQKLKNENKKCGNKLDRVILELADFFNTIIFKYNKKHGSKINHINFKL